MRHRIDDGMPLFFKLWFGFIACMIATVFIAGGYLLYAIASAGPDGIGKAIGQAAGSISKGFEEGRR